MESLYFVGLALAAVGGAGAYYLFKGLSDQEKILGLRSELLHETYKKNLMQILHELDERISYSLDVNKIIEVICHSLDKLLEYQTVSYMVMKNDRIECKINLRESVSRVFIEEIKHKMLTEFSTLTNQRLNQDQIDENLTGASIDAHHQVPVGSFFNLPVMIDKKIVGLISFASAQKYLYKDEDIGMLYKITDQAANSFAKLKIVLENEKSKLNALVASLSDGLVMVDADLRLLVINPQARKILNLDPQKDLTAMDVLGSLSEKMDLHSKIEQAILHDQTIAVSDIKFAGLQLQITVLPVKDSGQQTIGAVVVFHDITSQKSLDALRDQFELMTVHELRSPLTNILTLTDTLLRDGDSDQLQKPLQTIRAESTDMLELVNDILDVAKLEAGKFSIKKNPTDIVKLVQEVADRYQARVQEKHLQLNYTPTSDHPQIPLDSFRIRQVLNNLLANAVKFTESGEINIKLQSQDKQVKITVSDTGLGISEAGLSKLFNKFAQLQSDSDANPASFGTGLGLVIAKGIIEAHGGHIGVDSKLGEGSVFWFTLPYS